MESDSDDVLPANLSRLISASTSLQDAVVTGKELTTTQTARGQDVIYRPTPHHLLSEAEFNTLVDPPPRTHQWLPTIRGAWLASVVLSGTPVVMALARDKPFSVDLIPDAGIFGFCLASILWVWLAIVIRLKPDRRKSLIERIRRVWP